MLEAPKHQRRRLGRTRQDFPKTAFKEGNFVVADTIASLFHGTKCKLGILLRLAGFPKSDQKVEWEGEPDVTKRIYYGLRNEKKLTVDASKSKQKIVNARPRKKNFKLKM